MRMKNYGGALPQHSEGKPSKPDQVHQAPFRQPIYSPQDDARGPSIFNRQPEPIL